MSPAVFGSDRAVVGARVRRGVAEVARAVLVVAALAAQSVAVVKRHGTVRRTDSIHAVIVVTVSRAAAWSAVCRAISGSDGARS